MEFKWIGWDKPETIVSRMALELAVPPTYLEQNKPGTFKFSDGTTQGWTLDQLYDSNDKTMTKLVPYTHPSSNAFYGFALANYQNLGLAAGAYPLVVFTSATSLDFYLESPDLSGDPNWAGAKGYSLDLQRNFHSLCTDPPEYRLQLQVRLWDKQEAKVRTFAETNAQQGFVFHTIKALQPYHMVWTAAPFADPNLELRFIRLRFVQPNLTKPGAGECLPKGAWLIGNVRPE